MPTRVLAFESDNQFARELETEFRSLGCEITVVDDVNNGLQAASTRRPDLILLTIELPRMSGYSVCNRIKRDADLKDIPLIIMSSESTDQTFEQHGRLATRAQDYVHKPVAFGDLLQRVRKFVNITQAPSASSDDDDVLIDDEVELEEDLAQSQRPSAPRSVSPSLRPIDADIDDFAEHAFGAIIDEPAPRSAFPSSPRSAPGSAPVSSAPSSPAISERTESLQDELRRLKQQVAEKDRQLSETMREADELKRAALGTSSDSAELDSLRREIRDLKVKLAAPATANRPSVGPSAREFLDLREQLNKKDKELLDLRDQLTHKDKELLNLRDATLAHERDKADLSDKTEDLTRQLTELQKIADAARNDKEAAAKRADDFKRKAEKVVGQLEEKSAELTRTLAKHATDLSERDVERERTAAEHAAALDSARSEYVRAIAEAEQETRTNLERALAEARTAAQQHEQQALDVLQRESAMKLKEALGDLEQRLGGEHTAEQAAAVESALRELERRLQTEHQADKTAAVDSALSEFEARLKTEHAIDKTSALDQLRREKEASERALGDHVNSLQEELRLRNSELAQANQTISQRNDGIASLEAALHSARGDIDQATQTIGIRDQRVATLEAELTQLRNEVQVALENLSEERRRLAVARDKWDQDQANLERVKDALATALIQVETVESRSFE